MLNADDDAPRFRDLGRRECECILARNRVGRLAFARRNGLDIIPLHYLFRDGALWGRTARDTRVERTSRNFSNAWPVAFEVDEVDGLFDWRSVVVHGSLHAATRGDLEWRRDERRWEKAVAAFRTIVPQAFTEDDPVGFRDVLIRIDVADVSGREASSLPSVSRVHAAAGAGKARGGRPPRLPRGTPSACTGSSAR